MLQALSLKSFLKEILNRLDVQKSLCAFPGAQAVSFLCGDSSCEVLHEPLTLVPLKTIQYEGQEYALNAVPISALLSLLEHKLLLIPYKHIQMGLVVTDFGLHEGRKVVRFAPLSESIVEYFLVQNGGEAFADQVREDILRSLEPLANELLPKLLEVAPPLKEVYDNARMVSHSFKSEQMDNPVATLEREAMRRTLKKKHLDFDSRTGRYGVFGGHFLEIMRVPVKVGSASLEAAIEVRSRDLFMHNGQQQNKNLPDVPKWFGADNELAARIGFPVFAVWLSRVNGEHRRQVFSLEDYALAKASFTGLALTMSLQLRLATLSDAAEEYGLSTIRATHQLLLNAAETAGLVTARLLRPQNTDGSAKYEDEQVVVPVCDISLLGKTYHFGLSLQTLVFGLAIGDQALEDYSQVQGLCAWCSGDDGETVMLASLPKERLTHAQLQYLSNRLNQEVKRLYPLSLLQQIRSLGSAPISQDHPVLQQVREGLL